VNRQRPGVESRPKEEMNMDNSNIKTGNESILSPEAIREGFSVTAPDDHILELRKGGNVIARFSQSGVTIDNILHEVESGKYRN